MSKYTTEIRFICENALGLTEQGDYTDVNDAIAAGRNKIFTFDYDLFDPAYKSVIETEFLRHYYTREIGFETVALFKLKLEDTWLLKLPKYNQLWESALREFDPFYDVDVYTDHAGHGATDKRDNAHSVNINENSTHDRGASQGKNDNEGENHNINKYSDTPQGALDGIINTDWLTNASTDDANNESHSTNSSLTQRDRDETGKETKTNDVTSNILNFDKYIDHVYGKRGSLTYAYMLKEWRDTFLNIDEMFLDEFRTLFMLIY